MKSVSLDEIDRNFHIERTVKEPDMLWRDAKEEPFAIYGLYDYKNQPEYKRMPGDTANRVSEGVSILHRHTAGGRVRFATDSEAIAIHTVMPYMNHMPHIALTGSAGFDLYVDDPASGVSRFWRPFGPSVEDKNGFESLVTFPTRRLRYITIHFPLYSPVDSLLIGLKKDAVLQPGLAYRNCAPIVYYGSSITQGGCASRPGNCYQNVIAQRTNVNFINLGFSGSCKAEPVMCEYLAGLSMSAFVCDYDHNAPDRAHLEATHLPLYRAIRKKHPDIPYIMISRYDFDCAYEENIGRRDVIIDTFRTAYGEGDKNVYFIDGSSVFRGPYESMCTVDGCHPTDIGFALLADAIGSVLQRAATQALFL